MSDYEDILINNVLLKLLYDLNLSDNTLILSKKDIENIRENKSIFFREDEDKYIIEFGESNLIKEKYENYMRNK